MSQLVANDSKLQTAEQHAKVLRAWRHANQFLDANKSQPADGSRPNHWTGQLSTSALSTATAISALTQFRESLARSTGEPRDHWSSLLQLPDVDSAADLQHVLNDAIDGGCAWLEGHQNPDGGFGDTDRSHSNVATTFLVLASWKLAGYHSIASEAYANAESYVEAAGSWNALRQRYGRDKTFVVPILSNCALAGLASWRDVPALPFEAAWLPQSWYRLARMPVVSYAVPALVAIGQAKFHFCPPKNPLTRCLRSAAREPTLRVLHRMQPESGGYLEATPLTSFVLMNLAAMGRGHLPVAQHCVRFILESRLADGSWPIDTNLATWVTSLSLNAQSQSVGSLSIRSLATTDQESATNREQATTASAATASEDFATGVVDAECIRWLLDCQHLKRHPFTGAQPGGWGWTDLSGAVPDSDDTPAALIALAKCKFDEIDAAPLRNQCLVAVGRGLNWLLQLQNRDGGWPTFCKGWGKLPFDRSGTDLTAHALRAFRCWGDYLDEINAACVDEPNLPPLQPTKIQAAIHKGFRFLDRQQRHDGSWLPLWFGNQDREAEDNPFYGTAKVLLAYSDYNESGSDNAVAGYEYLISCQNEDGGWGGGPGLRRSFGDQATALVSTPQQAGQIVGEESYSSIEETSVVMESLLRYGKNQLEKSSIMRGLDWLCEAVDNPGLDCASPIGFYFAKLWYYEKLYPAIFACSALGVALRSLESDQDPAKPPGHTRVE